MRRLGQLFRRFVLGAPPRNVADWSDPFLGRLVWDEDCGHWAFAEAGPNSPLRVHLAGHHQRGPDPRAVHLINPLFGRLRETADQATTYLARGLTDQAGRPVGEGTLLCEGISVYAGEHPTAEVDFTWQDRPTWALRVSLTNGLPTHWAFDS